MTIPEISIETVRRNFSDFMNLKNNQRIIFSGSFGSGKTYFLDRFFSINDSYFTIRVSPVNYVTAQNEDIFELIKFDILFQMLHKDRFPESLIKDREDFLRYLYWIDPVKKLEGIFEKAEKTNHDWTQIDIKYWLSRDDENTRFKDYSNWKNLLDQKHKKSGINERNSLSKLISLLISAACQPEKDSATSYKESVLIIDDLDRIDPEHIFRILNIFAAHVDVDEHTNKFGFNRVITVCDIQNIRQIFSSRYGQNTDFSGYIDKFYSRYVFEFNNRIALEQEVKNFLESIIITPGKHGEFSNFFLAGQINFLPWLLLVFLRTDSISLRSLKNNWGMNYTLMANKETENAILPARNYHLVEIFNLLSQIVGSSLQLEEVLIKIKKSASSRAIVDNSDQNNHLKMGHILAILDKANSKLVNNQKEYIHPKIGDKIVYSVPNFSGNTIPSFAKIMQDNYSQTIIPEIPDIFPYLIEAFNFLKKHKVF